MSKFSLNFLKQRHVSGKACIIGVDIGSRFHYFQCQTKKKLSQSIYIENTKSGFQKLHNYISQELKLTSDKIIIGMEPTSSYWKPLADYLEDKGYEYVLVNPSHTHKYSSIVFSAPLKRDQTDTTLIINLIKGGHYQRHPVRSGVYKDLYNLANARHQLVKYRTQLYNQLHALLAEYFPELIRIFKNNTSIGLLRLLSVYPTPEQVKEAGEEAIYKATSKHIRKKLARERSKSIMTAAANSIGIKRGISGYKVNISLLVSHIQFINQQIKDVNKQITSTLSTMKETDVLRSINGVGDYTIAVFLGYFGDIMQFKSIQEAIKYAGLNLYERSSGQKIGSKHISKRGPGILREVLYLSALSLIRHNPQIKEKYLKLVENKHSKIKSIIPIMHYLIRVMFRLIKTGESYNVNYTKRSVA